MFLLHVFLLCFVITKTSAAHYPWIFNGSTPNIRYIFEGRCFDYQELIEENRLPALTTDVNCIELWKSFSKVFKHKDSCETNFTEANYDDYFSRIKHSKQLRDKALFWSGTRRVAHDFTHISDSYVTLEDTFPGYVANNLKWCGCRKCKSGIDFHKCTQDKSCSNPMYPYWDRASKEFAELAEGTAHVMLKSTPKKGDTAYYRGSTFGRVELPTLGKNKLVEKLIIYLVADIDREPVERCGEDSLAQLEEDASAYGISIICVQDPIDVQFILCAKYPNSNECKHIQNGISKTSRSLPSIALIVLLVLFTAVVLGYIVRQVVCYSNNAKVPTEEYVKPLIAPSDKFIEVQFNSKADV